MSHDHSNHGGDGDDEEGCPMIMIFHSGHCETILFKSWVVSSFEMFFLSAIAIFLLTVLYEGLKFLRERMNEHHQGVLCQMRKDEQPSTLSLVPSQKTLRDYLFDKSHIIQTLMHFIQISISYGLMLIVMTYNVWLCFAVVFGSMVGYYLFGWARQRVNDPNECCN